jgi:hypothetical protein
MLNIVRSAKYIPTVVLVKGIPYSTNNMYDIFHKAPRFCEKHHTFYSQGSQGSHGSHGSHEPQEIGKIIAMMKECGEKESMLELKAQQHCLQFEANRINHAIDEIASETARNNVRDIIRKLTVFESYEHWNITEAAKKYNITGADVLCAIVARNGRNESKYRQLFDNTSKQALWFKDVDGVSVDNLLPVGNDNFILRMAVFGGTLYNPIVRLLSSRVL